MDAPTRASFSTPDDGTTLINGNQIFTQPDFCLIHSWIYAVFATISLSLHFIYSSSFSFYWTFAICLSFAYSWAIVGGIVATVFMSTAS